jgi:hypothetical protein
VSQPDRPKTEGRDGRRRPRPKRPSGAKVALAARRALGELTGLEAESVTGLASHDDGTWTVTIEVLELSRIPETDDVLGSYEVTVDSDGEIVGYKRTARYPRSYAYEAAGGP